MRQARIFVVVFSLAVAAYSGADCTGWKGFAVPVRSVAAAAQVVLVGDLDGDGAPDIITSGNHIDELSTFSLFPNRGDGVFGEQRLLASGFGERLEDIGDLNRDGIPDLVASDYWQNGIAVHLGQGTLRFATAVTYATATHGGPTRLIDSDHDGALDVVSFSFGSGNPVRIHLFRGQGDGTLGMKTTLETTLANATSPSVRLIGGALEILVGEHSGHLGVIRFAGGGATVETIAVGPGYDLTSIFADVNGDGVADIVDTNDGGTGSESEPRELIFVTLAKADGTFFERRQIPRPRHVAFPVAVQAGDIDRDGRVDLVVSDFRSPSLYYFRGDGEGSFDEAVAIDAGGPVNDFKIADVNGDGAPDLVTVNNDHTVSVIVNRGLCHPTRRRAVTR